MRTDPTTRHRGRVPPALKALAGVFVLGIAVSLIWMAIHDALRRRELVAVTDRLTAAIERGRHYSAENNAIVTAHFSLGTDRWSVRAGAADLAPNPSSAPSRRLGPSARETKKTQWRFLAFRALSGKPASPSLVFFPDGAMQGGEVELGWRNLRRRLRMDSAGRIEARFVAPPRKAKDEPSGPPLYYEE